MNRAMIYIREIVMKFSTATKKIIVDADFLALIESELTSIAAIGNKIENIQTSFPKRCTKCGKIFVNMEAFNRDTDKLARGRDEVCYVINREVKIYKFRNCPSPCHSTLVTVCDERRDKSFDGLRRRQIFDRVFDILLEELKIEPSQLHSLVLYLTRAVAFEGLDPKESIDLLKQDIKSNRFEGFLDEPLIFEKIDTMSG